MSASSIARQNGLINVWQEQVIRDYANGEFSTILDVAEKVDFDLAVNECGDTLLVFLVRELSSSEGVDCVDEAASRVDTAITQLMEALRSVQSLGDVALPASPTPGG